MPVQHVKGQPAASTYVREKGCLKKDSNRETPCITKRASTYTQADLSLSEFES